MNEYILAYLGVLIGTFVKVVIEWQKGATAPNFKRIVGLVVMALFVGTFVPLLNGKVKQLGIDYLGISKDTNPIIQIASLFGLASEMLIDGFQRFVMNKINKKVEE